ncbi:MAG: hydrogen gas-evolving membrane-bound hydrogenase subunit E [Candidatus Aenigmatarchaeota archaeon]
MKKIIILTCLAIFFISFLGVIFSPIFNNFDERDVTEYYLENALQNTGSSNIVSSIVWDFRAFDTMGEETVLFTSVAAISALIVFIYIGRGKK